MCLLTLATFSTVGCRQQPNRAPGTRRDLAIGLEPTVEFHAGSWRSILWPSGVLAQDLVVATAADGSVALLTNEPSGDGASIRVLAAAPMGGPPWLQRLEFGGGGLVATADGPIALSDWPMAGDKRAPTAAVAFNWQGEVRCSAMRSGKTNDARWSGGVERLGGALILAQGQPGAWHALIVNRDCGTTIGQSWSSGPILRTVRSLSTVRTAAVFSSPAEPAVLEVVDHISDGGELTISHFVAHSAIAYVGGLGVRGAAITFPALLGNGDVLVVRVDGNGVAAASVGNQGQLSQVAPTATDVAGNFCLPIALAGSPGFPVSVGCVAFRCLSADGKLLGFLPLPPVADVFPAPGFRSAVGPLPLVVAVHREDGRAAGAGRLRLSIGPSDGTAGAYRGEAPVGGCADANTVGLH